MNGISSTGTGGARARCSRRGAVPCLQLKQEDPPLFAPSARARSRHARTAPGQHAKHRESRCARTAAASAAATGLQHAHAHRTAQRTHRAPPPCAAASSSAADTRHHARTTTHNDENVMRAQTDTTPETPVDGVRWHWTAAPATRSLPCSSHASVAHTATRPRHKPQGPASAYALTTTPIGPKAALPPQTRKHTPKTRKTPHKHFRACARILSRRA